VHNKGRMAHFRAFMTTRKRWGAGVLIAATALIFTPAIAAAGPTAATIKINTTTHTVTTSKFHIQFGNSGTNAPNDPERVDSLTWKNSSGMQSGNLAVRGGTYCTTDARESWGQSYGSVEGQQPYLVVGGSTGTWTSPAAGQVLIKTNTPTTCATHIPITTTYTFFDTGLHANEIKILRTVPFGTHHYANPSQEGLRVYVPRLSLTKYNQVLYPDSSQKLVVSTVCDNCAPLGSSAWGGRWFADNSSADNSGLLVLRATTDQPGAELEIDQDGFSGSNNTAIDLPQPTGGWKASVKEVEYLCFYDATSWPLSKRQPGRAVTLPAGCGA
jgi:hypothetical protein